MSVHRTSTAVLSGHLMRVFDTTGANLGFLHFSLFYFYAPLQVPAGLLTDRFGAMTIATVGAGL